MKLTTEQIQIIETALNEKCNFKDFDDVRIELVDHIATEIEQELETNVYSFEQAFVKVMTRWNPLILPKSWSWYDNVPYIVCQLWKKLDLKLLYLAIPVSAVYVYFFTLLLERNFPVYSITVPIILTGLGCTLFLVYRKFSNKTKTTMGGYALYKIYGQTLAMLLFFVLFFINERFAKISLFPLIYISFVMIGKAWVMKKHIKIENQLLKVM